MGTKTTCLSWKEISPHLLCVFLGLLIGLLLGPVWFSNDEPHAWGQDSCPCAGSSEASMSSAPPMMETVCNDQIDNDSDTFVDCNDHPDCSFSPSCAENCTNTVDDDGDFDVDCDDDWCIGDPACD